MKAIHIHSIYLYQRTRIQYRRISYDQIVRRIINNRLVNNHCILCYNHIDKNLLIFILYFNYYKKTSSVEYYWYYQNNIIEVRILFNLMVCNWFDFLWILCKKLIFIFGTHDIFRYIYIGQMHVCIYIYVISGLFSISRKCVFLYEWKFDVSVSRYIYEYNFREIHKSKIDFFAYHSTGVRIKSHASQKGCKAMPDEKLKNL